MTIAPRRYVLSDGKGRPSWADEKTWKLYEDTNDAAVVRGYTGMSCGWVMQPKPHGEYRISDGDGAITVSEATPQQAVVVMSRLLDRIER